MISNLRCFCKFEDNFMRKKNFEMNHFEQKNYKDFGTRRWKKILRTQNRFSQNFSSSRKVKVEKLGFLDSKNYALLHFATHFF